MYEIRVAVNVLANQERCSWTTRVRDLVSKRATLHGESFDHVSVESRLVEGKVVSRIDFDRHFRDEGKVKSERKEPEPYNSAATSTSSSSSSSFSFTVGCPRLTFRTRYTSRTRKPRRVRLQTEFACKTRSSRRWRSFIVQPETLEYPYVVAFPASPALKRYSWEFY